MRSFYAPLILLFSWSWGVGAADAPATAAFRAVSDLYRAEIGQMGLTPTLQFDKTVAVAHVQLGAKSAAFAANPALTAFGVDDWEVIFCHEVGHVLGGAPYTWVNQDDGGELAAEGQADYFAAAKCLRRLWSDAAANAAAVHAIDPELHAQIAAQGCATDLCQRIIATTIFVLATVSPDEPMTITHRSPVIATDTASSTESLPNQCRLDTTLAGALCAVDPKIGFARENQKDGACLTGAGARPRCWFAPVDVNGLFAKGKYSSFSQGAEAY